MDSPLPWIFESGARITATPAVADEIAYLGNMDGTLFAVPVDEGRELWRFETGIGIHATPTVSNGTVYVGNKRGLLKGNLFAIDAATGREQWRFEANSPITMPPEIVGDAVYCCSHDGVMYAIDAATGAELWQIDLGEAPFDGLAVAGNMRFLASRKGTLFSIDVTRGPLGGSNIPLRATSAPVVAGDLLILSTERGLLAIDWKTMLEVWLFPSDKPLKFPPVISSGLACSTDDSLIHAIDITSGEERWNLPIGGRVRKALVIAGDSMYYTTWDRRLYAIDLEKGTKSWSIETGRFPLSAPVKSNEMIIAGCNDGNIYGFKLTEASATGHLRPMAPVTQIYSSAQQPLRLAVLLFLVGYFYEIYWFFRNWRDLKRHMHVELRPGWRTVGLFVPFLNLYLMYDQFRLIRDSEKVQGLKTYSLFLVTTGFLSLNNLTNVLPEIWHYVRTTVTELDFWLLTAIGTLSRLAAILILVAIQKSLNVMWEQVQPGLMARTRFTRREMVLVVIFGAFTVIGWGMIVVGRILMI